LYADAALYDSVFSARKFDDEVKAVVKSVYQMNCSAAWRFHMSDARVMPCRRSF